MTARFLLLLSLLGAATPGYAQKIAFTVEPDHADAARPAIVRLYDHRFEVNNPGKAVERVRRAVTVLGHDGREEGLVVVFYDRLRKLKDFEALIRDADGRIVRKLKRKDMHDVSAISDYSLYDDSRVRYAELYHSVYPYTIDYTYELEWDGLASWPTWIPQERGLAVERAVFEVEVPADFALNYDLRNMTQEPEVTTDGQRRLFRWQVENLDALEREARGPHWLTQAMSIRLAPHAFEVEGTHGSMASWEQFGAWYHRLADGRDRLPPEIRATVHRLTDGIPTDAEKAAALYRWFQERTRYVSVQLGLGGWQPFAAEYVIERGYGDCKALTNYMQALLTEAGVTAYPALIRHGAGAHTVVDTFASNQFNHVILHLPNAQGEAPIWLECTSQTIPFGHIGAGNENRYALVVTPEGGRLTHTPESAANANQQVRHAVVRLAATGDAEADVATRYTGNQQDHVRGLTAQASGKERLEWLHTMIALPSFDLVTADFGSVDRREPEIVLPFTVRLPRFAARSGTRLFVTPNLMERWTDVPPAMARTQPVTYPYAFLDADTIRYMLPAGFRVEAVPEPVALDRSFGYYRTEVTVENGALRYTREVAITQTSIPAEHYDAFRAFLQQIVVADRAQVVLVEDS